MITAIKDGIEKHTLPHLEAGALTYMMSKQGYLNDDAHSWVPHLMFYFRARRARIGVLTLRARRRCLIRSSRNRRKRSV
jgi:hypothetical protein